MGGLANHAGVSVRLGNGDFFGTFENAPAFAAGMQPSSVAVGDLNGDGIPDLVVAHFVTNDVLGQISVLLGDGHGTFKAAVNYDDFGYFPSAVAIGDFNGDGAPDLVVADYGLGTVDDGNVSIFVGNGDGTFQAAVAYAAGTHPESVAVGDFNGDGRVDLAVADSGYVDGSGSGVSVLLGNGNGTFQTAKKYAAGFLPSSLAVGDFNGDGKVDLAVANYYGTRTGDDGNVSILAGNGDGTFQAAVDYAAGTHPESVAVADFNGDGRVDLAVANIGSGVHNPGNVSILVGNGDGTFQAAVDYAAGSQPEAVVVGDFNGDGAPDLVVRGGDNTRVLLGNGDGTFQSTSFSYLTGGSKGFTQSMAVGDFHGDGLPDVAVGDAKSNTVVILANDGIWDGSVPRERRFPGSNVSPQNAAPEFAPVRETGWTEPRRAADRQPQRPPRSATETVAGCANESAVVAVPLSVAWHRLVRAIDAGWDVQDGDLGFWEAPTSVTLLSDWLPFVAW
jgi:hypothetical protein